MNEREQLAKDNGMTIEFVNWFFDNKKDGCGNAWFIMMAAMWEGWSGREAKCAALAAENAALKSAIQTHSESVHFCELCGKDDPCSTDDVCMTLNETPSTDTFLAEVRAQAHKEGAHFVANRMLAAWESGFIEDTAKNAADIARMILTSTEFMADAPEGDFDRSFADGVLEDIAAQLRKGAAL
ncbi:ead/Ea22-like family protein [Escherichia coli]|uniref:ead/Ea22-like family protein n=1 Tax=Escherichia coli TaxID=562 RepID=UPI003C2ADCFB